MSYWHYHDPVQVSTWLECCRIANSLSWIRRMSSSPVLRCSGFSSRTQEARSVHCSNVSSETQTRPFTTTNHPRLHPQGYRSRSYLAGFAGHLCAGLEPPSAAPSRPSSQFPGCSSCRHKSRPEPTDDTQGSEFHLEKVNHFSSGQTDTQPQELFEEMHTCSTPHRRH